MGPPSLARPNLGFHESCVSRCRSRIYRRWREPAGGRQLSAKTERFFHRYPPDRNLVKYLQVFEL